MTVVYNKSKEIFEPAELKKCPRCSGFGGISSDMGLPCILCAGYGKVWISDSGWVRIYRQRRDHSRLW